MTKSKTINSNEYDYKTRSNLKTVSFDENGILMPVITHVTNTEAPYSVQREGKHIIEIIYQALQKPKSYYYTDNKENKLFLSQPIWALIKTNNPWIVEWISDRHNVMLPVNKEDTLGFKAKESRKNKIEKIKEIFPDFYPEYEAQIHTLKEYVKEVDSREVPEFHQVEYIREEQGYVLKKILFKPNGELKGITYIFGKVNEE